MDRDVARYVSTGGAARWEVEWERMGGNGIGLIGLIGRMGLTGGWEVFCGALGKIYRGGGNIFHECALSVVTNSYSYEKSILFLFHRKIYVY